MFSFRRQLSLSISFDPETSPASLRSENRIPLGKPPGSRPRSTVRAQGREIFQHEGHKKNDTLQDRRSVESGEIFTAGRLGWGISYRICIIKKKVMLSGDKIDES